MARISHEKGFFHRHLFAAVLIAALILPLFSSLTVYAQTDMILDLANYSERYLSDSAIADGGSLSLDGEGNIIFSINSAGNSLRFKCTGAFSSAEQNAVCLKLKNGTGSTRISVEIVFMDMQNELHTYKYEKRTTSSDNDCYIFIPSPENLFVTSITLKATGVGAGDITVMGIWHCYYYFGVDGATESIGSLSNIQYTDNGASVHIEGLVHHDVTISSEGSSINAYRLLPGEIIDDAFIESNAPCASSPMSRSFNFTVPNEEGDDYASAYAVVILDEDGKLEHVIEDKRYPSITYKSAESDVGFKGISTSLEFLPSGSYADTVIIEIPTDYLISDRMNGYLYSFCGENYCFDSEIINNIDRRIASSSLSNGNIYLRLILNEPYELYGAEGTVYDADGERAKELYAMMSFLCERYPNDIGGVIAGEKFDLPEKYQNLDGVRHADYVRKYSDYLSVLSAALRNKLPSAKVILPLSSSNSRIYGEDDSDGQYPMSAMLISLLEIYSHINNAPLTLMICDDSAPSIERLESISSRVSTPSAHENEDFRAQSGEIMNISAENTKTLERLIASVSESFDFIESKYFFSWEPTGIFSDDELIISYAYNYFELCSEENVYSFICDFTNDERRGFFDKSDVLLDAVTTMGTPSAKAYIDEITLRVADFTLKGVDGYDNYTASPQKSVYISASNSLPTGRTGSYPLADLSDPSVFSSWKTGAYSEYLSMASVLDGKRALKSRMLLPDCAYECAEIIYSFDSPVDLSQISDIAFTFMIENLSDSDSNDYSLRIVVGGGSTRCICKTDVTQNPGEPFTVSLNLFGIKDLGSIEYIKISIQNHSGTDDDIVGYLISADAYSNVLNSNQIKELFQKTQEHLLPTDITTEGGRARLIAYIVFASVSFFSILAIIVYGRFQKDDTDGEDTDASTKGK